MLQTLLSVIPVVTLPVLFYGLIVDFLIITKPVTSHIIDLLSLTTLPLWLIPNLAIILFSSLWYGEDFIMSTVGIWALASLIAAPLNVFVVIVVTTWQSTRIEKKLRIKGRILKLENVL